ncbi:MAG: transglycosylase SLT domain-containing protein [Lysobacteraceae bacterium]
MSAWQQRVLLVCAAIGLSACTPQATKTPPPVPIEPAPAMPVASPAPQTEPAPLPMPAPDLHARLRNQLQSPTCTGTESVDRWARLYGGKPERFAAHIERIHPLLDFVLRGVEQRQLPGEFALIPLVESDYNPAARARSGPAGMWQFTADTARSRGLQVNNRVDERMLPGPATDAALGLLQHYFDTYQNWQLAMASYNAGGFRIRKLLERTPLRAGQQLPDGTPRTTHEYLDKLEAWRCLFVNPERYGLALPNVPDPEPLVLRPARPELRSLDVVTQVTGLSAQQIAAWNPTLARSGFAEDAAAWLLPRSAHQAIDEFSGRLARGEVALPPPREHEVRAGDTLSAIAKRYGLSTAQLMRLNRLTAHSILRIGQRIRLEH